MADFSAAAAKKTPSYIVESENGWEGLKKQRGGANAATE